MSVHGSSDTTDPAAATGYELKSVAHWPKRCCRRTAASTRSHLCYAGNGRWRRHELGGAAQDQRSAAERWRSARDSLCAPAVAAAAPGHVSPVLC